MVLIFLVGIAFYMLAWMYQKNKLLYTLLGIGTAVITQFLVGIIYGLIYHPTKDEFEGNGVLFMLSVVFSIIVTSIVYTVLKKKVEKEASEENNNE